MKSPDTPYSAPSNAGDDDSDALSTPVDSDEMPENEDEELDDESGDEEEEEGESDEEILELAKARFELAQEAEQEQRKLALEDIEFRVGKQWPDQVQAQRDMDGRPCLVINRIPQFVQQVTNDQRQNRPAIKIHPVDDVADIDTAKVIQGLIRHIEYHSNAEMAYDTAFESAVVGGFGYFRVVTDYSDSESFEQDVLIKRIRNPMSVYFDPYSEQPDGSDARWAQIVDELSAEEYREMYPDSEMSKMTDWESVGLREPGWVGKNFCRVAEYFYIEEEDKEILLLSDGTVIEKDAYQPDPTGQVSVVKSRQTKVPCVRWCKHNAIEILDRTTFPGKYIPIVPVHGAEVYYEGKRVLEGVIRNAKDSQRMYNYWASAQTEAIALAPRAPFIGVEGQFEGYEGQWREANRRNHAYLQVKPVSVSGVPAPLPQRNVYEPAVQAITQARQMAADDLKATTGIYDASLGAQSNETSGVAIQRRNTQAQTSNFHFTDNLTRSMKHLGRILLGVIPSVYDTARAVRIMGDDGDQRVVKINQHAIDPKTGKPMLYRLDVGKYDVTVDVGPSYSSRRQEAVASILDVSKSFPQIMSAAGDILVKSMDWPGAADVAERLQKMLPPQLQPGGQQPLPPQVQTQMQQMNDMIGQLTQELHKAHDIIDQKRVELESKERIEMAKLETEATIALSKLQSAEALKLLEHQINEIDARTKQLGFNQPFPDQAQEFVPPQPQQPQQGPAGAIGASGGPQAAPGGAMPTGGPSPGQPMEPPKGPMQ